ncbi:serine--tRNA ligase [Candidatus Saccharibacteria bacterium]|nr:serine--tRNA ligase [Candidatus Saccharibacteria bacterium]
MLDPKFVAENLKEIKEVAAERGMKVDVSELEKFSDARSQLRVQVERLRAEQNRLSKRGRKKKPTKKDIERATEIKQELKNLEPQLKNIEEQIQHLLWQLPNLIHPKTPRGGVEKNKVLKKGKPKTLPFKAKNHEELSQNLDLIDFEAGSNVAGAKFYYLKNEAALLEFALIKYAFDLLMDEGFTPFVTPDLAKSEIIDGVGFVPRGPESNIYMVEEEDLGLIGTAEITLGGYHADQVLKAEDLPLKYAGFSHCFRREAGTYGQESKGLYRVHQFSKVEMFVFCRPEESEKMHDYLLKLEEKIFKGLKIPYRVVDIASGDLGAAAYRKFDLEAWMPGRGEWGEITSTSNTTDYQARRLNVKYKRKDGATDYLHTLNGTAIAISRALIAILENYQQEDGSVKVPTALVPYVGKKIIRR